MPLDDFFAVRGRHGEKYRTLEDWQVECNVAFSITELERMARIYDENKVEPTDAKELESYLKWKKQHGSLRGPMPKVKPFLLDAFFTDIIDDRVRPAYSRSKPLPSMAEASIRLLKHQHDDGWDRAMKILYEDDK